MALVVSATVIRPVVCVLLPIKAFQDTAMEKPES